MISLRTELEGLIVPSKFYGIAAAGRPAVFIGDQDGEVAREIVRHDAGRVCRIADGAALAAQIVSLANDPACCGELGKNSRKMFDEHFDRVAAVERWVEVLRSLP